MKGELKGSHFSTSEALNQRGNLGKFGAEPWQAITISSQAAE